jgi:hypothetical protein
MFQQKEKKARKKRKNQHQWFVLVGYFFVIGAEQEKQGQETSWAWQSFVVTVS